MRNLSWAGIGVLAVLVLIVVVLLQSRRRSRRAVESLRGDGTDPAMPARGVAPAAVALAAEDAPATPHATSPGDDGRRTSSRPPPPVRVEYPHPGAPPSLKGDGPLLKLSRPADEEGEQTLGFDGNAAQAALREALAKSAPPTSGTPPRPDSKRSPMMRPPAQDGVVARIQGKTMAVAVLEVPRGWDERVEARLETLMHAAMAGGEDVLHCLATPECHGVGGCSCGCAACVRRAGLEADALREIKGPLG